MCSRNCSTILNFTLKSIHYGTYFHNREVSFDIFRVLVPSGFQKPRFRCEFDRRTKFQWPELEMRDRTRYTFEEFLLGNLLSVMVFFNVKTVGFNYCLIDSLNVFTLRCIAALVLATLSDSKTMKDEELFSLISTRRQYYLDSMTLATLHFKLRLRRKRRTLLPKLQPLWWMECCKLKSRIPHVGFWRWNSAWRPCIIYSTSYSCKNCFKRSTFSTLCYTWKY